MANEAFELSADKSGRVNSSHVLHLGQPVTNSKRRKSHPSAAATTLLI
jgi:hypothetical protein